MRSKHAVPLLACALLSGCGRSQALDRFELDMTESGTPWAKNHGSGSWDETTRWTAEIGLELGVADGLGADVFGNIRAVAVGLDGTTFVLDDMTQEIRAFDSAGTHVHSFGRRGDGPGEFRYADGIILDSADNIWVYDPPRDRLLQFEWDGTLLRELSGDGGSNTLPPPERVLEDGTIVGWIYQNPGRDYNVRLLTGDLDRFRLLRVDPVTGVVDSLPGIDIPVPTVGGVRIPLAGRASVAVATDGSLWFSDPSGYRLFHRTSDGDTLLVVSLEDARRVPLSRQERDSVAHTLQEAASRDGYAGAVPRADDLPTHRPAIERILLDDDGHLFVLPRVEGDSVGHVLDVFLAGTGEYLGRLQLPMALARTAPALFAGGRLFVASQGELNVPRLIRLDFGRDGP